jgi:hypothetical protein
MKQQSSPPFRYLKNEHETATNIIEGHAVMNLTTVTAATSTNFTTLHKKLITRIF